MADTASAVIVGACAGIAFVSLAVGYLSELVIPVQVKPALPPPPKKKTLEERVEIIEKKEGIAPPPPAPAPAPIVQSPPAPPPAVQTRITVG